MTTEIQAMLTGIDIKENEIRLHFNVPLRNHSGKYSIIYHKQSKKIEMEAKFLGEAVLAGVKAQKLLVY